MEHTAWALVQHIKPYHPEGDKTRSLTEFVLWIHTTQQEAARHKADFLLRHGLDNRLEVRKVGEESWSTRYGHTPKEKPPAVKTAEAPIEEPKQIERAIS